MEEENGLISFHTEGLSSLDIRSTILDLEEQFKGESQAAFPLRHHFAPGVYGREIVLLARTLVIGKVHKHAHLNVVSKGRCEVLTEWGVEMVEALRTLVSKPGTKP